MWNVPIYFAYYVRSHERQNLRLSCLQDLPADFCFDKKQHIRKKSEFQILPREHRNIRQNPHPTSHIIALYECSGCCREVFISNTHPDMVIPHHRLSLYITPFRKSCF
jgi:hypothetical protein